PGTAGGTIIFASIVSDADQVNRNLVASRQPDRNWHVSGVSGFGDVGVELLDGSPTYVSQHLNTSIRENGGHVGFWNDAFSKELTGYPERIPPIPVPLPTAVPATLVALTIAGPILVIARRRRWQ